MPSGKVPQIDFEPTIVGLIRRGVERFGDHDLVVEPGRRLSYVEVDRLSRSLAKRLLIMGVGKGTRVAAKYPNGAAWLVVMLAVTRIGGFFMPLSSVYTIAETRKCLRIGDAEFLLLPELIVGRDQRAMLGELLETSDNGADAPLMLEALPYLRRVVMTSFEIDVRDDTISFAKCSHEAEARVSDEFLAAVESQVTPADWMLAIFTSGSTSDPKCVIHTHGAAIRHATAIDLVNHWTGDDRIFAGMPFFWVGGNCYTVLPSMLAGAAVLCMERFEAGAALDLMETESATRVVGWPGVINPLLDHPSLPGRRIAAFDDPLWHPSVGAMTGLGMSETAANHTIVLVEDRALMGQEGFVGRPIPHSEHRIVDPDIGTVLAEGEVGNIQVRGYNLMAGFYKREREEVFELDGFYDTQDRGFFCDGYLFFQGRDVGLIKTAGNNVSALEVEGALKMLPGVSAAFVVGLPDDQVGQVVGAAIVPQSGETLDLATVAQALRTELSSYKVPKVMRLVDATEVPYLSNGKLDFRRLVALVAQT